MIVYVDGQEVPQGMWRPVEGDDPTPAIYREAFLLQNDLPWVLGADTSRTELNATAQVFATDDEELDDAFEGALAGFGIWGGIERLSAWTKRKMAG